MHCIKANFDKILAVIKTISKDHIPETGNFLRPGPVARFTDLEVVALSLTAECLGIDSELYLFAKLHTEYREAFPNLVSRRQYNDRRKSLFSLQETIRASMAGRINELTQVFAVDSMPLEICKTSRIDRNRMGKDNEYTAPSKGFCASQNKWYYGYKLHATCSPSGVIHTLDLTAASVSDVYYLKDISSQVQNCIITGDKGYINKTIKEQLMAEKKIDLQVPYRWNQKEKKPVCWPLKKIRKRIETVFSQLCDQFMMQRNYAKTFGGYKTRILAKISGFTVLQFINRFIKGRPVGQVKYALR